MTFYDLIAKRIETSNTSIPDSPDFVIKNPLAIQIFVNIIELIPNFNFAEKGQCVVINSKDRIVFDSRRVINSFTDYSVFNVPLIDEEIGKGGKLEFFIWNDTDSETIALNLKVAISELESTNYESSSAVERSAKNRAFSDGGIKTTADGGSGIVSTIYKCPDGKRAKVLSCLTRVKATGSASEIRILLRGTRKAEWFLRSGFNPLINTGGTFAGAGQSPREVFSDSLYGEFNGMFNDFVNEELRAGETIAYDGNFSSNFNATISFAISVLETREV